MSMLRDSVRDDEPAKDVRGILAKYATGGGLSGSYLQASWLDEMEASKKDAKAEFGGDLSEVDRIR